METSYFLYLLNFISLNHENFKDVYAVVRKGLLKVSFKINFMLSSSHLVLMVALPENLKKI